MFSKAKESTSQLLDGPKDLCDCANCYGQTELPRLRTTIRTHRQRNGVHPDSDHARMSRATSSIASNLQMSNSDVEMEDVLDNTHEMDYETGVLSDAAHSSHFQSPPHAQIQPQSRSRSRSWSWSRSRSWSLSQSSSCSGLSYVFQTRSDCQSRQRSPSPASSDSEEEAPALVPTDAERDALFFGKLLSQEQIYQEPPPLRLRGGDAPEGENGGNMGREEGNREDCVHDPEDPDDPDDIDDPDDLAQPQQQPEMRVPPIDPDAGPRDPDNEDDGAIPLFNEDPILRNLYLRVWLLYAFGNATHDTIQAILESHQLSLRATARAGVLPPPLLAQIEKMPRTLRALERRIGMDFSDLIVTYPICPIKDCGKRYTMDELNRLDNPQCTRQVADPQCPGILYTESVLADGKRKRTPSRSFPYNPLPAALGRLTSRIGIPEFMQHWRGPGDEPADSTKTVFFFERYGGLRRT